MLHLGPSSIRQEPSRSKKKAAKEHKNKKPILPTDIGTEFGYDL